MAAGQYFEDHEPPIYRDDYQRNPSDWQRNAHNPNSYGPGGAYSVSTNRDPETGRPYSQPTGERLPPGPGAPPIDATLIGVMNGVFPNNFVNMQAYLSANKNTGVDGGYQHQLEVNPYSAGQGSINEVMSSLLNTTLGGKAAGNQTAGMDALDKALEGGYGAIGGQYWTDMTKNGIQTGGSSAPTPGFPSMPLPSTPNPSAPPSAPAAPGTPTAPPPPGDPTDPTKPGNPKQQPR